MSEYRSVVYYQQRHQRWMETVKVCTSLGARGRRWDWGCDPLRMHPSLLPHSRTELLEGTPHQGWLFRGQSPQLPCLGRTGDAASAMARPLDGDPGRPAAGPAAGRRCPPPLLTSSAGAGALGALHRRRCSCIAPASPRGLVDVHCQPCTDTCVSNSGSLIESKARGFGFRQLTVQHGLCPSTEGSRPARLLSLRPPLLTQAYVLSLRLLFPLKMSTRPT